MEHGIAVRKSRTFHMFAGMLFLLFFICAAIWFLFGPNDDGKAIFFGDNTSRIAAWALTAFFAWGLISSWYNVFDRKPMLYIDESGIFYRKYKKGIIKWPQINGYKTYSRADSVNEIYIAQLVLILHGDEREIKIDLFGLSADQKQLRKYISKYNNNTNLVDFGHKEE